MLDIEEFRTAGHQAIDRICDYYKTLDQRPVVAQVQPGYLRELIPSESPQKGEPFQQIADDFQKLIMPGMTLWAHPSFFAYFPGANTMESLIADLYAGSVSSPGFNWICSPAATELEAITMDWAAKLLGLDESFLATSEVGGGIIQPTASDSCLTAVVAARSRYAKLHSEVPMEKLVIYGTTMTHSLGSKAALILGLRFRALEVSKSDNYGLRGDTLRQALEEDTKAGISPFILIATVGSTSSGAIDNIDEIAEVSKSNPDLWIHVDAAWAGVALACPEFRDMSYLPATNQCAHSYCTNFHKWGLVNFESSGMWIRDRNLLTDALDVTPEFLRTKEGDAGTVIDYRNWQLALGRRFRALKLWFVFRSYGIEGFQAHIRKSIGLAEAAATLFRQSDQFEIVTPPSFALLVFRVVVPGKESDLSELNSLNRIFFRLVSKRRDELFVIQTDLQGAFCIRLAIGAQRTEESHIKAAFALFQEEASKALEEWKGEQLKKDAQVSLNGTD